MSPQRLDVLCIDDDPQSLQVRKVLLETHGFRVITATSGPEGLRSVRSHDPAVVVVDYQMPGMDGGEVAREMKKWDPTLPVVILSALPFLPLDAPNHCIDAFVSKTDPLAVLVKTLHTMIATRHYGARHGGSGWTQKVARAAGAVAGLVAGVASVMVHRPRKVHQPQPASKRLARSMVSLAGN